mmetsp:Transcript_52765/g.77262  ORF Transcript_52765/g.77262 Transcript_52765/m.77262 type:complete len:226 (+) Transcript_52765:537-1214(+)
MYAILRAESEALHPCTCVEFLTVPAYACLQPVHARLCLGRGCGTLCDERGKLLEGCCKVWVVASSGGPRPDHQLYQTLNEPTVRAVGPTLVVWYESVDGRHQGTACRHRLFITGRHTELHALLVRQRIGRRTTTPVAVLLHHHLPSCFVCRRTFCPHELKIFVEHLGGSPYKVEERCMVIFEGRAVSRISMDEKALERVNEGWQYMLSKWLHLAALPRRSDSLKP